MYEFSYIHFHLITCMGILQIYNMTSSQFRLDSSVGKAPYWYCRGHGFESRSSLNYFPGFLFPTVQVAYITTMVMHSLVVKVCFIVSCSWR